MIETTYFVLLALIVAALLTIFIRIVVRTYLNYSGKMVVKCPETKKGAAVKVDVKHAAVSSAFKKLDLRLEDCSRWPERQDCGQECLHQIESAPHDCLVRSILSNWYRGRRCVYCGREFEEINWHDHKPALIDKHGKFVEWTDLRVEKLPSLLDNYRPVCWNCYIAEDFRHQHPDLVVDRPPRRHQINQN